MEHAELLVKQAMEKVNSMRNSYVKEAFKTEDIEKVAVGAI